MDKSKDGNKARIVRHHGDNPLHSPPLPQFVQEALSKNDSTLEFDSPAVNSSLDVQSLHTFLHLDNGREELKGFKYYLDPTFDQLDKKVITETGIIIVTVSTTHSFTLSRRFSVSACFFPFFSLFSSCLCFTIS